MPRLSSPLTIALALQAHESDLVAAYHTSLTAELKRLASASASSASASAAAAGSADSKGDAKLSSSAAPDYRYSLSACRAQYRRAKAHAVVVMVASLDVFVAGNEALGGGSTDSGICGAGADSKADGAGGSKQQHAQGKDEDKDKSTGLSPLLERLLAAVCDCPVSDLEAEAEAAAKAAKDNPIAGADS